MANISIKYPEYPLTESFDTANNTVIPLSVTSHPQADKVNIAFDIYDGRTGGVVKRVGNLIKVRGIVFAEFTLDNNRYVLDITVGKVSGKENFDKSSIKMVFMPSQIRALKKAGCNYTEVLRLLQSYVGKDAWLASKLREYDKYKNDSSKAFSVFSNIIRYFGLDGII